MSNYKKFTLDTIKQKLKNGDYAAPVGAMRAIGKTQELTEEEKEKGRAMVRKHFGVEASAPKAVKPKKAKKTAKKVAKKAKAAPKAKKVGKKAAAKPAAAKKVAKKAVVKKARAKSAPTPEGDTVRHLAAVEKAATSKTEADVKAPQVVSRGGVIQEMSQVISTVSDSLKAMEAAKRMFPKGQFDGAAETAVSSLARAVTVIDETVTKPRLDEAGTAQTSSLSSRKKAPKKGTRVKAAASAPSEEPEAEDEEPEPNGTHQRDLTEEEQEQLRLARLSQSSSAEG